MIQSNDGGANITFNSGKTWSTQFNQPTAEIYQVEVDDQYPYWLYGGQQDNYSTVSVPSLPPYGLQAGPNALLQIQVDVKLDLQCQNLKSKYCLFKL